MVNPNMAFSLTGTLTNDFFVNLTDMENVWKKAGDHEVRDRATDTVKWTANRIVGIWFNSPASYSELYRKMIIKVVGFIVRVKVMDADRFVLKQLICFNLRQKKLVRKTSFFYRLNLELIRSMPNSNTVWILSSFVDKCASTGAP